MQSYDTYYILSYLIGGNSVIIKKEKGVCEHGHG